MPPQNSRLTIDDGVREMIDDTYGLYSGSLRHYLRVVMSARNFMSPYHNGRHMLHVPVMCYHAIRYYDSVSNTIDSRRARNMLVGGLMHDHGHMGRTGNDDLNIQLAIRGLDEHILPEDVPWKSEIAEGIGWTQYPYTVPSSEISLEGKILRDADKSQMFSEAWIQQTIGLAQEMGLSTVAGLMEQRTFLKHLKFDTDWGKLMFGSKIEKKIAETEWMISVLQ